MERAILLIFLCMVVEGRIGKHHYISLTMNWLGAQNYCRQHYTDLSSVNSQSDQDELMQAAGPGNDPEGWIGLHRDPNNNTTWKWSGGGGITYENWGPKQPDNYAEIEDSVQLMAGGYWNDNDGRSSLPFYCVNITLKKEKRSWEEALKHCRRYSTNLPSLLSKTDLLQVQRVIQEIHITDSVWIGLRYLRDRWLWVNNDSLEYEDWPQGEGQDHQCPIQKRCGALTISEAWENRNCQDELSFICV
ncbi:snaclec agkisacutacin subunit B-like [Lates japonicus]